MAKLFCEQAHFKHAQSAGGFVGPQSEHRETRLGRPRGVEAFFKKRVILHAYARCRSSRFKRDAVEPEAGHGCRRNNQAAFCKACAVLGLFPGR